MLELALSCRGALPGAFGRKPVGVVGPERYMPAFTTGAEGLPGKRRVDRRVGDATPRGVPGVSVVQRAVEVPGHNPMRAVGANHRAAAFRVVVSDNLTCTPSVVGSTAVT